MSDVIVITEPGVEVLEVPADTVIELSATVEVVELGDSSTIEITETPTILEVIEPALVEVTTTGTIGPEGPEGKSFEEVMLTSSEEKDLIEDSPAEGDLTVYHGIAQAANADPTAAVWLITRTIYTAAADFDSSKRHAGGSILYDQVWNDHLTLTY